MISERSALFYPDLTNADVGYESDRRSRHGQAVRFQSLSRHPKKHSGLVMECTTTRPCCGASRVLVVGRRGAWILVGWRAEIGTAGKKTNERCQERRECRRSVRDNQKACSCWPGPSHRLGDGCDTVLSDCAPSVRRAYLTAQKKCRTGSQMCFALAAGNISTLFLCLPDRLRLERRRTPFGAGVVEVLSNRPPCHDY